MKTGTTLRIHADQKVEVKLAQWDGFREWKTSETLQLLTLRETLRLIPGVRTFYQDKGEEVHQYLYSIFLMGLTRTSAVNATYLESVIDGVDDVVVPSHGFVELCC